LTLGDLILAGGLRYAEELIGLGYGPTATIDSLLIRFPEIDRYLAIDVQAIAQASILAAGAYGGGGGLTPPTQSQLPLNPAVPAGKVEVTILVTWPDPRTGRTHRETVRVQFDSMPDERDLENEAERLLQLRAEQYSFDATDIDASADAIAISRGA
jgi:hypothetical protein